MSMKPVEYANSPTGQFHYRLLMSIMMLATTSGVGFLLNDGVKTRERLQDYQYSNNERIAKLEGTVLEIKGSVDAHRRRLDNNDSDIRAVWNRMYELVQKK